VDAFTWFPVAISLQSRQARRSCGLRNERRDDTSFSQCAQAEFRGASSDDVIAQSTVWGGSPSASARSAMEAPDGFPLGELRGAAPDARPEA